MISCVNSIPNFSILARYSNVELTNINLAICCFVDLNSSFPSFSEWSASRAAAADRCAGGREIQRADVEVRDLFRREEREPAAACDYAADVVPLVEMRWGGDGVAEPDAREHGVIEDSEAVFC